MHDDSSEFDPTTFDPQNSPEEMCWAALPELAGSIRATTLYHLGAISFAREDFLRSSTLAEAAADAFKATGIFPMAAEALLSSSRSFASLKEVPEAMDRCRQAIDIFLEIGESAKVVEASSFLATLLIGAGEFADADVVLAEALDLVDRIGGIPNHVVLENLHASRGESLLGLSKYSDALSHFNKARDLAIANERSEIAAHHHSRVATCRFHLKHYTSAITDFLASFNAGILNQDHDLMVLCGTNLILCYRVMGDFEAASRHIEMLKPIVQVSNDVRLKAFYQSEVAQMYAQQQNYVGAVEAAEQSFAGFSFTGETLSLFQAGIVAAISLTSTDRHNEARAYLERVSVLAAENPVEVIDANDRETLRLVQLWAWAAEVQVTSGWENHFVTHPLETDYSISETLKRFEELNEVTFDMLEIAPFQVAELLVLKTETLFENCEQSSISSIQSQACISHILEIFEKCDSDISPLQRARLHHLLAKVRSHRYEAFRSFAQALAIYVEIEDRDKIMELVAEIKQLASYRTEEEIEKAWNQPKSQKAKAVKTSLEG